MRRTKHFVHSYNFANVHMAMDVLTMAFLGCSWREKRSLNVSRYGYLTSRASLILHKSFMVVIKILLFVIAVTGPSTATSCVLIIVQGLCVIFPHICRRQAYGKHRKNTECIHFQHVIYFLFILAHSSHTHTPYALYYFQNGAHIFNFTPFSNSKTERSTTTRSTFEIIHTTRILRHWSRMLLQPPPLLRRLCRHGNILLHPAGISLFLNTFGWELVGIITVVTICRSARRYDVWKTFCFLPSPRDGRIVSYRHVDEEAFNGMGDFCTEVCLCGYFLDALYGLFDI